VKHTSIEAKVLAHLESHGVTRLARSLYSCGGARCLIGELLAEHAPTIARLRTDPDLNDTRVSDLMREDVWVGSVLRNFGLDEQAAQRLRDVNDEGLPRETPEQCCERVKAWLRGQSGKAAAA
jgi:hypothetical protein